MDAMVGHRTEYAVQAGILLLDLRTVVYVNRCAVAFGKRFGGDPADEVSVVLVHLAFFR